MEQFQNHAPVQLNFETGGVRGQGQGQEFLRSRKYLCFNEERFICYLILFSILIGYCLFMINDAPYATEHYTLAVPLLISVIFLSTVTNQILAAFSNPGVIVEVNEVNDNQILTSQAETTGLVAIELNNGSNSLKFCTTCKVIRPPEAQHCKYCDVCVYQSDNHCPYLGNCIGLKNYKNFYYFIVSVVLFTSAVFTFSLLHVLEVIRELDSSWKALQTLPVSILLIAASLAGGIYPLGLIIFQAYVMYTGVKVKGSQGK